MTFLFFLNKPPLIYAIKRRDSRAVRLLLDFNADLNLPTMKPPLFVAAKIGFYEGVKMLREKGAVINPSGKNPLIASIESGNRECFTAMIENQENIILKYVDSHSLSYHAIKMESNLLPLIASITQTQIEEQKKTNNFTEDELMFPPKDIIDKKDKKKFNTALDLQDHYLPYKQIKQEIKNIKSVFIPIQEVDADQDQNQEEQTEQLKSLHQNILAKPPSKRIDSTEFLPQMPINSSSSYENYESGISDANKATTNDTKRLSKIEEINVNNQQIIKLSQEQLNKEHIPSNSFSNNDDDEDYLENEENGNNGEYEEEDNIMIEEEEEDAEYEYLYEDEEAQTIIQKSNRMQSV